MEDLVANLVDAKNLLNANNVLVLLAKPQFLVTFFFVYHKFFDPSYKSLVLHICRKFHFQVTRPSNISDEGCGRSEYNHTSLMSCLQFNSARSVFPVDC